MTDNRDQVIAQALRNAQAGAKAAGYDVNAQGSRSGAQAGSSDRDRAGWATGSRGLTPVKRHCDETEIGVSVTLTGTAVVLTYPADVQKSAQFPMAWLTFGNKQTDRLIARHVDPAYLRSMVLA